MTRLSDTIKIGEFVMTSNVAGYEGCHIAVFLGIVTTHGEGLILLNWLNARHGIEKVFLTDFNKTFCKVKLVGIDKRGLIIVRRVKSRYVHQKK